MFSRNIRTVHVQDEIGKQNGKVLYGRKNAKFGYNTYQKQRSSSSFSENSKSWSQLASVKQLPCLYVMSAKDCFHRAVKVHISVHFILLYMTEIWCNNMKIFTTLLIYSRFNIIVHDRLSQCLKKVVLASIVKSVDAVHTLCNYNIMTVYSALMISMLFIL